MQDAQAGQGEGEEEEAVTRTTSAMPQKDGVEDDSEAQNKSVNPRRHTVSFDFMMMDMKKADFNAVFKGMANCVGGSRNPTQLPPIDAETAPEVVQEHQEQHSAELTKSRCGLLSLLLNASASPAAPMLLLQTTSLAADAFAT